ncbi:MAG: hypothetical protein LBK53_00700 [Heliobacteriaceae bacterium]|jgi:hypothetical protein|nr:hypothetical protein [Heliobacteriaceae bacterium]
MGMAASQARFLGLTARKTNVEYEGQQINQQRTALGNQSANYYNQMLGMSVPKPPSVNNFTKTVYSFEDGSLKNTITSLIARPGGEYTVSYLREWQDDFAAVSAAPALVTRVSQAVPSGIAGTLATAIVSGTAANITGTDGTIIGSIKVTSGTGTANAATETMVKGEGDATAATSVRTIINKDGSKVILSGSAANSAVTIVDVNGNITTGTLAAAITTGTAVNIKGTDGTTVIGTIKITNGTSPANAATETMIKGEGDVTTATSVRTITNQDGSKITLSGSASGSTINSVSGTAFQIGADILRVLGSVPSAAHIKADPYLSSLSAEQLAKLIEQERLQIGVLNSTYGEPAAGWVVRYIKNSNSGAYEPQFYNLDVLNNKNTTYTENGQSQSNIPAYKMGTAKKTEEIKGIEARLEQDATGRIINITMNPNQPNEVKYALTTNTITDQAAYDDAMNQYEFDKHQYDQTIQEVNAKIEIIQVEDRNLELRLKQLDTEQNAISTEMDAVSKVIEKNVESTFKTFG